MVVHVLTKFSTCLYLLNLVPTCTCACTAVVRTAVVHIRTNQLRYSHSTIQPDYDADRAGRREARGRRRMEKIEEKEAATKTQESCDEQSREL